jgi:DNA-binding winged helix-turn-helix (wHTH) protein
MAGESGADQIQFGPFRLDVNGSPVFRDGADLTLRQPAVGVLKALLGRPGQSMDYEKLLKPPRGTTFVSRHSVVTTFSEMRKTLEEYGPWIGYRLRVGCSLNIPRSDDQIRIGWHLSEPKDPRRAGEASCLLPTHGGNRRRPTTACESTGRLYLMPGMYGACAPREMYKGYLKALRRTCTSGGLLRPYVVPRANDPALWGPYGKPIIGGTRTGHRHARQNRIQSGSWGLCRPFLTEFVCWT